jgi:hypothetical protein
MIRLYSRLTCVALSMSLAMAGCNSDTIVDDWGPSAGYARLTGRVTTTAGLPISGAEVSVARCSHPIVGMIGSALTSTDGTYSITGALPPVGLLPPVRADTIRARCGVFINRSPMPVDSIDVRFAADSLALPRQVLDLTVREAAT